MELIRLKVYFILLSFHIYASNLDTIQEEDTAEGSDTKVADRTTKTTSYFRLPASTLQCENNICSLQMRARIPFTSITIAGKIIVGYNVITGTENTISGEGRLIYSNNSTGTEEVTSYGLRLSIVLEGLDGLQIKLDIICGKDESTYSMEGIGTDLPSLCTQMPGVPTFIKFCITIGDYKYFHDERLVFICLRAEIQLHDQRVITLLYKCLSFTERKLRAINEKLKSVSTFTKNRYDSARQTLKSLPSFRRNSMKDAEVKVNNK